jgi:CubicO group peptidase (beta-lactamase class C family)
VIALLLAMRMATTTTPDSADGRWAPLRAYLEACVAHGAFPGAVVAVGRRDTVLFEAGVGHLSYDPGSPPPDARTIYDLASLTKVVGLTTVIMMLVERGKLDLDAPVTRYVPAFTAGGDSVTVRQLLTHSSGLLAWLPLYQEVRSRAAMFARVNATPLETPPGTRTVYSDLGAIILTEIVEHLTGQRLDRLLERRVFRPLGMRETRFNPPARLRPRIAPTEDDPWRGRVLRGEVHDENAAAMGGVSGHAGLFSTAADLVRFARMMLRYGTTGARGHGGTGARLVDSATIAEFTRVQDPARSSRALGWDTPSAGSSAGTRLSAHAFGHTGFTGTSIWIDPAQDLFVILLTNRVHPTRRNEQILQVRPRVADLAVEAAGGGSVAPR